MNDAKLNRLIAVVAILVSVGAAGSTSVLFTKVQKLENKTVPVFVTPSPLSKELEIASPSASVKPTASALPYSSAKAKVTK